MDLMELKVTIAKKMVKITTTTLIITFVLSLKRGLVQTNGRINGPTHRNPKIRDVVL